MYFVVFLGLFLFRVLKENPYYYVSDHKAWADKIYRRFQSCRIDYNKISNRGKFGKSGQGQFKGLTALQKWKHNDTPSLLPSTSKVRRHSSSPELMWCSADSHHPQTVTRTNPLMTATRVARATQEKTRLNNLHHRWHLHLPSREPRSEPETWMRRHPRIRRQPIKASSWQWWRSLRVTLYGRHQACMIVSGKVFSLG